MATTLLGVYLAVRYDWISALRLLGVVWLILMGMSLISGVVAPGFAVMKEIHPGAWSGGWWEKNQLGGHAARAVFLFGFLAWRDERWRKLWIGSTVLSVLLVVLSTSMTALLGTLIGLGVLASAWWMVKGKHHSLLLVWLGFSVVGVLAMVFVTAPGVLLSLIGRDPTFTGRTDIWDALFSAISQKPLLGYGYLAFWGLDSEPRYWLSQAVDWNAPSGHNGWLDLAISLGLVGVVIFAIDFVATSWRAVKLSLASPVGVFAVGFLAQYLLFAMSESIIVQQNSILWATYAMISTKLALGRVQSITPERTAPSVGAASTAPSATA
jgi:exopolysaccharide production protein ExoQ